MELSVSLQKSFDGFGLDVNFSVTRKRIGIFGCSGSGKSTLIHMIAGLLQPDGGRLELNGELLYSSAKKIRVPPEKRRIAVVFQQAHLFPHLSARRNLLYGYRRTPPRLRRIDPDALIEVLDLVDLLDRNVKTLSGGERQRVALGRAVLANPRLLLMDEPLSALDEGLKDQIIPYLGAVFEKFNVPVLFVSHSVQEMRLMTEEVIVMDRGRVCDQTRPEALTGKRTGGSGRPGLLKLAELWEKNLAGKRAGSLPWPPVPDPFPDNVSFSLLERRGKWTDWPRKIIHPPGSSRGYRPRTGTQCLDSGSEEA